MNNEIPVWDPLNEKITSQSFGEEQRYLLNEYESYKKRPYLLKLFLAFWIILAIVFLIFIIITGIVQLVIGFAPVILYYGYVMKRQEKLILYLICEKNQWAYNPGTIYNRAADFVILLPLLFKYGYDQNLDEQIWGRITSQSSTVDFWSSEFEYTTGSGRSARAHTEYIFIFRLARSMPINFTLEKAGLLRTFEEYIKTESDEFNKIFQIESDTTDTESKQQIIRILSPSVITRLIDFSKSYKPKKITFQGDIMAIALKDKIWKTKYTNFFKQVTIDPRDETQMYESLKEMAELPSEMIQFIG